MYRTDENIPLYRWNIFEKFSHIINTGLSCRTGGVSVDEYASFNQALHCGEKKEDVIENRKILCRTLGIPFDKYTCAEQTHGSRILRVTHEECGAGRNEYGASIKNTDALIIDQSNILINIHMADCVPIAIFDTRRTIGALIHAGWKGTAQLIALKTIEKMVTELGCTPEYMIAGIGPSISSCCFEIGRETVDHLSADFSYSSDVILKGNSHYRADLKKANQEQLLAGGLNLNNIELSQICTSCSNKEFYSYRADKGKTGRFAAFMFLK